MRSRVGWYGYNILTIQNSIGSDGIEGLAISLLDESAYGTQDSITPS